MAAPTSITNRSSFGMEQIIQAVFDSTNGSLKTTPGAPVGTATEVSISHVDDSIRLGDGTRLTNVTAAGALQVDGSLVTQPISAVSLPLPTGLTISATRLLVDGSGVTQPVSGTLSTSPAYSTRADTFTTTASGTTVNTSTSPLKSFTISVKGTGASATTWDIRLEGSLDNVNFTQILQHTNTTGDGVPLFSGSNFYPSLYFRSRVSGLVLGSATNVVVTILGVG